MQLVAWLAGLVTLLTWSSTGVAQISITPTGPEEIVFVHQRDACEPIEVPDAAARAFRDASGRVHLFASHYIDRAFVGPSLGSVKHDCNVAFKGAGSDDPARFDDREWLASFWTENGKTVYSLASNEFQANLRPWLCPSRRYVKCWYNSIVAAISVDGGFHFRRQGDGVVAAASVRYDPSFGRPIGYFGPSNIIKRNGYYYATIWAERVGRQKRGVCLMRTDNLGDPASWRAWDGAGFTVRLGSPYRQPSDSAVPHACAVIDFAPLGGPILSLVRSRVSGRYVALSSGEPTAHPAFFVSESSDLLTWSRPRRFFDRLPSDSGCKRPALGYASLIDPDSPSRNFDDIGDTAYLYYTRFHLKDCHLTLDRDLGRMPVRINSSP
jgi:hypothetical protein